MEAINLKECGTHLFRVSLWCGCGYVLNTFNVYACCEEESLERVLAHCEKYDFCELFVAEDYIESKLCLTDEERDEMFLYVDPTMTDIHAYPAYFRCENLRIENLGRIA